MLRTYVLSTMYTCAFSAQYTANIQLLFNIDDIVQRMPANSFAAEFPATVTKTTAYFHKLVNAWKMTQSSEVKAFLANGMEKAGPPLLQKNTLTCRVDGKDHKIVADDTVVHTLETVVFLLRYPLYMMEKIQRGRTGVLLSLDLDGKMLNGLVGELEKEMLDVWARCLSLM